MEEVEITTFLRVRLFLRLSHVEANPKKQICPIIALGKEAKEIRLKFPYHVTQVSKTFDADNKLWFHSAWRGRSDHVGLAGRANSPLHQEGALFCRVVCV